MAPLESLQMANSVVGNMTAQLDTINLQSTQMPSFGVTQDEHKPSHQDMFRAAQNYIRNDMATGSVFQESPLPSLPRAGESVAGFMRASTSEVEMQKEASVALRCPSIKVDLNIHNYQSPMGQL